MEAFRNAAVLLRTSFIQTEQRSAMRDAASCKSAWRRLILHDYRHVSHAASKARRNVTQSLSYNLIEFRCPHTQSFAAKRLFGDATIGSGCLLRSFSSNLRNPTSGYTH